MCAKQHVDDCHGNIGQPLCRLTFNIFRGLGKSEKKKCHARSFQLRIDGTMRNQTEVWLTLLRIIASHLIEDPYGEVDHALVRLGFLELAHDLLNAIPRLFLVSSPASVSHKKQGQQHRHEPTRSIINYFRLD